MIDEIPEAVQFQNKILLPFQAGYSNDQAQIALQLSIDAYCGNTHNEQHTFDGPAEGFVLTKPIFDSFYNIEGFVGYLPSDSSIYVVFRGTILSSLRNILTDLDGLGTSYLEAPECECLVHDGFKRAANSVWD